MSARRNAARGGIRGPQSALTDFLASHNISAQEIRESAERRRAAAEANNVDLDEDDQAVIAQAAAIEEEEEPVQAESSTAASSKKRKRGDDAKSKGKEKAKMKKRAKKGQDSESDFDEGFGMDMYKKSKPMPGQLENCDICNKRFTVTPYSKEGPDGGLLCTPCGKQMTKETKAAESKARKAAGAPRGRRKVESKRLDGDVRLGGKSLQDLCIEKLAQHHTDIEEFGDMPQKLVDRISQIFSKKRVLDPRTLQLFLHSDMELVAIHDAANLGPDEFKQIFAVAPKLRKLVLRNAGQFKDAVMDYMLERATHINYLHLYGANLLTNEAWIRLFETAGENLETLKIQWCDAAFTDDVVEALVRHCKNLKRLKLKFCRKVTSASLPTLCRLKKLEHLSLKLETSPEPTEVIPVISALGPQLRTLSLEGCPDLDDAFVEEVATKCGKLSKLRITDCECISDVALTALFTPKAPDGNTIVSLLPPLTFLDLSSTRDVDHSKPEGPDDKPMGVASSAFKAIMAHSGATLRHLDIASCRHISHGAFCDVFSPAENDGKYSELNTINLTFCAGVETSVIKGIFACCRKVEKIVAFGCFKVGDVVVPQGVALIGVPRAQDAIEKIGESGVGLEEALGSMSRMVGVAA